MMKKSICDNCSQDCVWRAPSNGLDPPVMNCREFVPKPITNYESLVSKSPEEMAEFLTLIMLGEEPHVPFICATVDKWLNWLRQETESGG